MKESESDHNNTYANTIEGGTKHISEVERGRKGYFCLGCNEPLEARKGDIKAHYFAHVPTDISIVRKCTYSDETYRHKLAKEILQRLKRIKVPAVHKYPPVGIDGKVYKISDSKFIEANKILIEVNFYENDDGIVKFGKSEGESEGRHLLIKPDVTFLDSNGNPILLIELVATHKIDTDKMSKLLRLGIDTVQVQIPKSSPKDIEDTFRIVGRTKWVYNYEQESTEYISVSNGNSEGVQQIDELQRKLLETAESFSCRSSQIKNLIRGIGKCLESKQYIGIEQKIGQELHRVKGNTESNRERLQQLREEVETRVFGEFRDEQGRISLQKESLEESEREFQEKVESLEFRYNSKRELLDRLQNSFRPECQEEIESIEKHLKELEGDESSNFGKLGNLRESARLMRERVQEIQRNIDDNIEYRKGLHEKYRKLEKRIRSEFVERRKDIERQILDQEARFAATVKGRVTDGKSDDAREVKVVLDQWRILNDLQAAIFETEKFDRYKELFKKRAYKGWNNS